MALPMSEERPLLRIEELVVRYGGGAPVLRGVSLDLRAGEIVGLIGPSGAGKSTLLRAIQRLVEPVSGRVFVGETEITSLGRRELRGARRRVGMIFQDHALVERLTVMENVLSGTLGRVGFWRGFRRRFPQSDVDEAFGLLARVGLSGFEDRRCDEISGGQKQRVGIAAIINLHDVALARRFCPRIVGIGDGRIVSDGPATGLDEEVLRRVYGEEGVLAPVVAS